MIQSGNVHPICSPSSYAIVFLPSMRYGSFRVETSYQPSGLPFSAAARPASVIKPSTSVTSAPYSSHSRMNGTFTSFGMNTFACSPADAAYAAIALAALPAEGTDSTSAPRYLARVTAADNPRALKEFVGLSDSSLTKRRSTPSARPNFDARINGVQPSPSVNGSSPSKSGISSRYRHIVGSRPASDSRFQALARSRS